MPLHMTFPISSRGEITVEFTGDPSAVSEAIRLALAEERPTALSSVGKRIQFRGGSGAGGLGNWHLLQPISAGTVEVSVDRAVIALRYELRFTQTLAFGSLLVFGFLAPVLMFSRESRPIEVAVVSVAGWLWLVGGNYVLSNFRFRVFLRRVLQSPRAQDLGLKRGEAPPNNGLQ
jgi:hypothetical protein